MKKIIFSILAILLHTFVFSQSLINGKLVWDMVTNEQRLDFLIVSTGEIANSGQESVALNATNTSQHILFYDATVTVTTFNGTTKYFTVKETIKPGENLGKNPFNEGYDFGFTGQKKDYGSTSNGGNMKSFISSVRLQLNKVRDITQEQEDKEKILKEKQEAADRDRIVKENKAKQDAAERDRIASQQVQSGSYYSNQQNNSNTEKKTTWQETNARILAENQQKYTEQRQRIAENQRINKEAGDALVQGTSEVINMIGDIFAQAREERERKQERAAQAERERQENIRIEQERLNEIARLKAQKTALRNSLFAEFPEGAIPLSSQKVNTSQLFFFAYAYDKNTIADDYPILTISNIFIVSQYGDGTWPFKSILLNDLKKIGYSGTIVLIGYFTTKELAEEIRNSFLDLSKKSSFTLKDIVYKGKESSATETVDFWENDKTTKPNPAGKATLIPAKGDEDFWETGKARKKAVEEKEKNTMTKPTPKKDDFWEN